MKYTTFLFIFVAFSSMAQVPDSSAVVPPPPSVIILEEENFKEQKSIKSDIFDFPGKEARFKGGQKALQQYISEKVQYPPMAIENDEQGRVFVSFVVEKNGTISNVKVMKGVSKELDREAIRVIKCSPLWKPARVRMRKVRSRCHIPIVFILE
jgi:periplasmic protein TonB